MNTLASIISMINLQESYQSLCRAIYMISKDDFLSIQCPVSQLFKLLLIFASTVILDSSLLKIHDPDFYSLFQVSVEL
jgi:hypothetical protein